MLTGAQDLADPPEQPPVTKLELDPCRGPEVFVRGEEPSDLYYTGPPYEWNGGFTGRPSLHGPNFRIRAMPTYIVVNSTFPWTNWEFDYQGKLESPDKCDRMAVLRRPQGETEEERKKNKSSRFQKDGYYRNESSIHAYKKNLWLELDPLEDRAGHAEVKFKCKKYCHVNDECALGMHIDYVVGPVVGLRFIVRSHFYACPTDDPDQAQVFWRRHKYPTLPPECADVLLLAECAKGMWNGPCHNARCCESAWNGNCTGPEEERYNG